MKGSFYDLEKADVEFLRGHTAIGSANYTISEEDLDKARAHLKTLYEGRVQSRFATTILLLYKLFGAELSKNEESKVGNEQGNENQG